MGKIFLELLPYYLSVGMTANEYWHGDNSLPRYYKKAQDLRERRANNHLYMAGVYTRLAVASALDAKVEYPEEPFPITKEEADEIRERKFRQRVDAWRQSAEQVGKG